jgi:hypothetical protein
LEPLLKESNRLDFKTLMEIGRAVSFLDGDEHACCWYRAAIAKGTVECRGVRIDDAKATSALALLDQTRALWRLGDYIALEARFSLALNLTAPLSATSRRFRFLHSEMLYRQERFDAAADAIVELEARNREAGDLGDFDKLDFHEMSWVAGLFLYGCGRFSDAIPRLEATVSPRGEHSNDAQRFLVVSYAKTGRVDDANRCFGEYVRNAHPSAKEAVQLVSLIELAQSRAAAK